MAKTVLGVLCLLTALSIFTGCERNDYQHPLHRSTK